MVGIDAVIHQPECALMLINACVGLVSIIWAGQRPGTLVWLRSATRDIGPSDRLHGGVAAADSQAPAWLRACGRLHLLGAAFFALGLVQKTVLMHPDDTGMPVPLGLIQSLLFLECLLTALSALLLANLTEQLSIAPRVKSSLPLVATCIVLLVFEAIVFALGRPQFAFLMSEGAWLLACVLMTAKLLRLLGEPALPSAARSIVLLIAAGFFSRALIAVFSLLMMASQAFHLSVQLAAAGFDPGVHGWMGGLLGHLDAVRTLSIAVSGFGLLLLAAVWRNAGPAR